MESSRRVILGADLRGTGAGRKRNLERCDSNPRPRAPPPRALRFVELRGGYCARGFSVEEERAGTARERNMHVGIGLNLQELFFGNVDKDREHMASKAARVGLEYVRIPDNDVSSGGHSGR